MKSIIHKNHMHVHTIVASKIQQEKMSSKATKPVKWAYDSPYDYQYKI
jgi:hypothetical protein